MNKENIRQLISVLENYEELTYDDLPVSFDMGSWINVKHDCETRACLGGHAAILSGQSFNSWSPRSVVGVASAWLGLDDEQSTLLFCPAVDHLEWVTREEAIETLKHLVETGKVEWRLANE